MSKLPIREIVMYKHGVAFFVREGETSEQEVSFQFRPEEMNDVLKSLTVFDRKGGHINGIYFQNPVSKLDRLEDSTIDLSDFGSLRDLIRDLRGQAITIQYAEADKIKSLLGRLIGIESGNKGDERLTILANDGQVRILRLDDLRSFRITDDTTNRELSYFLDSNIMEDKRRSVTVRLNEGEHQLVAYYIAPSPTWRVSYRIVAESTPDSTKGKALLQGWGIFDNQLDEDLENVRLTLIAGQPISFIYNLYSSYRPDRAFISEENRNIAPMEFERGITLPASPVTMAGFADFDSDERTLSKGISGGARYRLSAPEAATPTNTETKDMGELFQYLVLTPVTVKRGESALVPIVSTSLEYERILLFNPTKNESNPVVTMKFTNTSDTTLERGPITVVEDGTYKGEAILPFTKSNNAFYVPFALELSVKIAHAVSNTVQLFGLNFEGGFLIEQIYRINTHTFTIENHTNKPQVLTLENANLSNQNFELFDSQVPSETTLSDYRWDIPLETTGIKIFVIKYRQLQSQRYSIVNLSYRKLQEYLDGKILETKKHAILKEVLDTIALKQNLNERKTRLEADITGIQNQNEELRKNLGILKESDETFRARLLKQLEESDARLTDIYREIKTTQNKVQACDTRVETLINSLGSGS
jgi:hypothetical protein